MTPCDSGHEIITSGQIVKARCSFFAVFSPNRSQLHKTYARFLQIDLQNLGDQDIPKLLAPKCDPKDIVFAQEPTNSSLLEELRDELSDIKKLDFYHPKFQGWHNTVKQCLNKLFGNDSYMATEYARMETIKKWGQSGQA